MRRAWRRARPRLAAVARRAALALGSLRRVSWRASMSWRHLSAPFLLVASFAGLILICTLGLRFLPGLYTVAGMGMVDSLFTATSAVCVTGLIVVDTATYFTFWGQLWVLLFIQLGGIGLLTLTTAIIGAIGGRVSIRAELCVPGTKRGDARSMWHLAGQVTRFTLVAEGIGALALFLLWLPRFSIGDALWHAVFHSVSAFCNAGFSTFTDSLEGFQGDVATLAVVSILIILGGVGYLVLRESWTWWRHRPLAGRRARLSTHSFAALVTTAALLFFGTVFYLAFEEDGVLAGMGTAERYANAWFMSVTARTAGFNAVPYGELGPSGGLLTMMLMFVGGSPGSTAGGLKTTTLAVLIALAWSRMHSRRDVAIHGRGVPLATTERTVSLTLLALAVLTLSFFVLTATATSGVSAAEARASFLPLSFEVMSAFCTVGLSMGITPELGADGKLVLVFLMFVGRVGLFSFFSAVLLRRRHVPHYRLASEDLIIG
jgi:trk system potassium uptake protein TrkH